MCCLYNLGRFRLKPAGGFLYSVCHAVGACSDDGEDAAPPSGCAGAGGVSGTAACDEELSATDEDAVL